MAVNTDISNATRFKGWMALMLFSAICLAASASSERNPRTGAQNWVLSVEIISMVFALFACCAYLFAREKFQGTHFESGTVRSLVWFRCVVCDCSFRFAHVELRSH